MGEIGNLVGGFKDKSVQSPKAGGEQKAGRDVAESGAKTTIDTADKAASGPTTSNSSGTT